MGYSTNNMYQVYIPESSRIKNDCDVKFDENKMGNELLNEIRENNQTNKGIYQITEIWN